MATKDKICVKCKKRKGFRVVLDKKKNSWVELCKYCYMERKI